MPAAGGTRYGLLTCTYCGGKLHIHPRSNGEARVYCYRLGQGVSTECQQYGAKLAQYEA